jgi:hypothetical protein
VSSDLTESTSPAVAGPKAKADIYTALLAVALFCLIFGIVMLVLEMNSFGWDAKGANVKRDISLLTPAASVSHLA